MINRYLWLFGRRWREEDDDGGSAGPTPGEVNSQGNRRRVDRLAQIANTADGNRARELDDVDGERVTGRFQNGELDESPEARERAAEEEEARAQQALEDQRARAEEEEREEARRLQEEGADEGHDDEPARRPGGDGTQVDEGDERLINGVKHYAVVVNGDIQWKTLKELRETVSKVGDVEKTLRTAEEALQRATAASLRPEPVEEEALSEEDLQNVFTAAVMGDSEAIKTLVPYFLKRNPGVDPDVVGQEVSRRLATQREIEAGEAGQKDILDHQVLGDVFKQRFNRLKQEKPTTPIREAYKQVGDGIRKDFAPLLSQRNGSADEGRPRPPADKTARKRTLVSPPTAASRQQSQADPDREVPVSETIDQMARSRGQSRAIRQGRR